MKEDINIIQEHINLLQHRIAIVKENPKGKKAYIEKMNREKRAFENLIKGYKELEEMLKHRIKYTNELEKDLFENASNYVIPKSKVKEIIQDIDNSQPVIAELKLRKLVEGDTDETKM